MLTRHAQKRSQQRAIPQAVIDLLLDIGVTEQQKKGLELIYFNNLGKRSAQYQMKKIGLAQSDHCLKVFLLESSDGGIVTVGHRTKKINRN